MTDSVKTATPQEWSPMGRYWRQSDVAADSNNSATKNVYICLNHNSSLANDLRTQRFNALFETIARLPDLPQHSNLFLDAEAAQKAEDFLGILRQNYLIDPPKIIPEEGDTLVFTWDIGDFRRYLSVASDWYDLLDIHNTKDIRRKHEIPQDNAGAIRALIGELQLVTNSSSIR